MENEIKIFSYNLNQGRYVSSKLHSRNISNLRKIYREKSDGYEEYLQEIYEKTTYPKEFSYEEVLLLLEEVFKGSTMESIKKIIKDMKNKDTSKKNERKSKLDDYA
ncbi:hypothetical protein [Methanosphaera sp. BMS]|uniref:hypothetical protein n=1 Tax=Methanosphaera sp. BMS TaxID=1789762 RepID=UPI000DC1E93A|nr:hypothetical protein [Methanosphaera sp. BMS]AWX31679.1 hypothetical protein AW729_00630 [Methanosphaera sp. BMS]